MARVGRPPKFETPEEMTPLIENYFNKCDMAEKPYTITGLALALGFESRQSLLNYEDKAEFLDTIKRAKSRVEQHLEESLFGGQVAGLIFNLKNNFSWTDKQNIEHTGPEGGPIILWGNQSE